MDNESRFCPDCGTENESKYEYCKNCGALLIDPAPAEPQPTQQPFVQQPSAQQFYTNASPYRTPEGYAYQNNTVYSNTQQSYSYQESNDYNETDNITFFGGVTAEEVSAFIGKKASSILPKFKKMEKTGRKVTWCWPVAVLSYILGPLGAALWFFYRKMYKLGWLLLACSVVLASVQTVVTFSFEPINDIEAQIPNFYDFANTEDYMESLEEMINTFAVDQENIKYSMFSMLFDFLNSSINIAITVICGMFAYYWYKKHSISEIIKFRNCNADMRYYNIGLMTKGGTSGGMVAVGSILYCVAVMVIAVAVYILM